MNNFLSESFWIVFFLCFQLQKFGYFFLSKDKGKYFFQCIKLMCRANDSSVQRSDVNGFLPIHYAVFADNVDVTMLVIHFILNGFINFPISA